MADPEVAANQAALTRAYRLRCAIEDAIEAWRDTDPAFRRAVSLYDPDEVKELARFVGKHLEGLPWLSSLPSPQEPTQAIPGGPWREKVRP